MEETKTYSWKQLLMVSSLIFGMFFGSGNLIFPVHLGQMAGANWVSAGVGFAISGALFPLLAILAVVVTKSDGLYDLAKPVGKYLNSLFLALLAIIFVVSLFHPMGNLNQSAADTYQTNALTNGVLEGYNTVDAVALLALSVTFVHAVRDLGFKDKKVTELTAKAGSLSVALEVMIYFGLVLLGAMSLNKMSLSENGGTALSQITNFYLGNFGASFLGVMVTLGVFTTAMGLVVSFAQDFHKLFPKVSYMTWLRLTTFVSFVVANAGLDNIIQWSLPVLMLLYPLSLALILLSLTAKFFQKTPFVYQVTMLFAAVPAVLDMLANSPALVSQQRVVASMLEFYHHHVPFAALGLGWMVPTLLGYAGSLLFYYAYRLSGYKQEANELPEE
ncbi:TPA: branched-chain amino acid transport system II carrier protein [Enterococcus faecium]|nr:branched-chain amino acid transport system II carrier protein [Enterococcus faecium]